MQGDRLLFYDGDIAARFPAEYALPVACIVILTTALVLLWTWRRAREHRAQAVEARAVMAQAKAQPLRPGIHVIAGRVHTADGEPAIRVRIEEGGSEWTSNSTMRHRWTEIRREVDARPFDVVTTGGTVRVEPDASVKLIDMLATVRRSSKYRRSREASLDPGERVFVSGLLRRIGGGDGAYRGGEAAQWVMQAPPGGVLMCSTESLAIPHERWARFYGRATGWAAAAAFATIAYLGVAFFPLVIGGTVVEARIEDRRHWVTTGRRGSRDHYEITARAELPDGREVALVDELEPEVWEQAVIGERVPFVVVPWCPWLHQAGRRPGLESWFVATVPVVAVVAGVVFVVARRRRRAWWEQKKVVTEGEGPLGDH